MTLGGTKADDDEADARPEPDPVGRPRAAGHVVETAAANHAEGNANWFMPETITSARLGCVAAPGIEAPLEHVPVHVVETPWVRLQLAHRVQAPS